VQHLTTSDKSLLVGNTVADLLMEYAALTAQISGGDAVKVRALSGDGDEVVATLLINSGSVMTVETTNSTQPEPDNADVEQYLRGRLRSYRDLSETYPLTEESEAGADA
jgi:hypothetical protein